MRDDDVTTEVGPYDEEGVSVRKRRESGERRRKTHRRAVPSRRGRPVSPGHIEVDGHRFISRAEAARVLGRGPTSMRRFEESFLKDATITRDRVVYYLRASFEELRQALQSDDFIAFYALFDEGLGPHAAVLRMGELKQRVKPGAARLYYNDYLETLELEQSRVVIELDPEMNKRDWKRAHGFPEDAPLHPAWVRCALERAALITSLREACDYAVERHEQRKRRARRTETRPHAP